MKDIPIIDLHQDLMAHINNREFFSGKWQTNFSMLNNSNVRVVVATAFPMPKDEDYLSPATNDLIERDFEAYIEYTKENRNWIIIKSGKDLQTVLASKNKRGLILHVEGLNSFEDKKEDWKRLERWYEMGWRSLGLVWNISNPLCGGTKDGEKGLTPLGRRVITWLKEHQMIIDLAHMNEPSFWDTVELLGDHPVYISHGNARGICESPRNYSDKQLKKVKESGGLVGVFFANNFLTKEIPVTTEHVLKHLDHVRNMLGIEHLAIGTDFGGVLAGPPKGLESVERLDGFLEALAQNGYSESDIEKMSYKNAERVLMKVLG